LNLLASFYDFLEDKGMEIFLMRHGIAEDLQSGEMDADRELTTKGINKTERVALSMQQKGWKFDMVLASPLVRACQTAQILLESGSSEVLEIHPNLAPDGLIEDWLQWLQSYRSTNPTVERLALVGHEPNLGQWAEILIFGQMFDRLHLKKAGVIALRIPETEDLIGKCELLWLMSPKCWI
jgi:phosphohistidine phosphatase